MLHAQGIHCVCAYVWLRLVGKLPVLLSVRCCKQELGQATVQVQSPCPSIVFTRGFVALRVCVFDLHCITGHCCALQAMPHGQVHVQLKWTAFPTDQCTAVQLWAPSNCNADFLKLISSMPHSGFRSFRSYFEFCTAQHLKLGFKRCCYSMLSCVCACSQGASKVYHGADKRSLSREEHASSCATSHRPDLPDRRKLLFMAASVVAGPAYAANSTSPYADAKSMQYGLDNDR